MFGSLQVLGDKKPNIIPPAALLTVRHAAGSTHIINDNINSTLAQWQSKWSLSSNLEEESKALCFIEPL